MLRWELKWLACFCYLSMEIGTQQGPANIAARATEFKKDAEEYINIEEEILEL